MAGNWRCLTGLCPGRTDIPSPMREEICQAMCPTCPLARPKPLRRISSYFGHRTKAFGHFVVKKGTCHMADESWISVASASEVAEANGIFGRTVQGVPLAVFEVAGVYYVTSNRCTHGLARMSGGYLDGYLIECPVHQGLFDIRTGEVKGPPCAEPLPIFPMRHEGEEIRVRAAALQEFQSKKEEAKKQTP